MDLWALTYFRRKKKNQKLANEQSREKSSENLSLKKSQFHKIFVINVLITFYAFKYLDLNVPDEVKTRQARRTHISINAVLFSFFL